MIPTLKTRDFVEFLMNKHEWSKTNIAVDSSTHLSFVFQIQYTISNHWRWWISLDNRLIIHMCSLGIRKPIYYLSSLQVSSVSISTISYNLGTVNILWGSDVCQGHCLSLWLSSLISSPHPSKRQAQPWGKHTPTHACTPTATHACAHTA